MSDTAFELGIKLLTLFVVLGIIAGIVFHANMAFIIIGAVVIEVGVGGLLLRIWGISYMSRQ